jgi:hypothetical protein
VNNLIRTEAEMEELKYEKSFGFTKGAEMNEETSMPPKDQDTMLGMIVLLLACLALAALAHVFV